MRFLSTKKRQITAKTNKMAFHKVSHVIFDMDGLLLETESLYEKILSKIIESFGSKYTLDVQMKVRGTAEKETVAIIVKELNLPVSNDEFHKIYKEAQKDGLRNPPLLPGVKKLVTHLSKKGVPIAVATSSSMESYKIKTETHQDFFKLFDHIVCASSDPEVKQGKPAPDIFLVCASRFPEKPHPPQCLVFEDAPNGVTAALKAGMQAVLVPAPDVPEDLKKSATLVLNSLEEFKPELFGLPPFN